MCCPLFKYLQKIAKTWNIQGLISDNILEDIIESFRKNHIIMIDVSLIKFRDKENGGSPSRLWGSVYLSQKNSESKRAKCWCSKEKYEPEKNSANYRNCKKIDIFLKWEVWGCNLLSESSSDFQKIFIYFYYQKRAVSQQLRSLRTQ